LPAPRGADIHLWLLASAAQSALDASVLKRKRNNERNSKVQSVTYFSLLGNF
jgi:hypothetical protein